MLIVDAGPLYAAAARRDRHHARCAAPLQAHAAAPLVVPALVITEVAYLLGDRLGPAAQTALARAFREEELIPGAPLPADWARITELCERYQDLPLGIVDASVVATAERLGATAIATLDHRHFAAIRPVAAGGAPARAGRRGGRRLLPAHAPGPCRSPAPRCARLTSPTFQTWPAGWTTSRRS